MAEEIKIFEDIPTVTKSSNVNVLLESNIKFTPVDSLEINIKNLSKFCTLVTVNNPNIKPTSKIVKDNKAVMLKFATSIEVVNKSKTKYRIPADSDIAIIGIIKSYKNPKKSDFPITYSYSSNVILINDINFAKIAKEIQFYNSWSNSVNYTYSQVPNIYKNKTIIPKRKPITFANDIISKQFKKSKLLTTNSEFIYHESSIYNMQTDIDLAIVNKKYKLSDKIATLKNDYDINKNLNTSQHLTQLNTAQIKNIERLIGKSKKDMNKQELTLYTKKLKAKHTADGYKITPEDSIGFKMLARIRKFIKSGTRYKMDELLEEIKNTFGTLKTNIETPIPAKKSKSKIPILCPHYIEHLDLIKKHGPAYNNYFIISKNWAQETPIEFKYFCKVCGELVFIDDLEGFAEFSETSSNYNVNSVNENFAMVLKLILITFKYIKFNKPYNLRKIGFHMTKIILPEITKYQEVINSSQTYDIPTATELFKLYSYIYIYGIMTKYILENPKIMSWNVKIKGFKPGKVKTETEMLKLAYIVFLAIHNTVVSNLSEYITKDEIYIKIVEAYKQCLNVSSELTNEEMDIVNKSEAFTTITEDVIYQLLFIGYTIDNPTSKIKFEDYQKILGIQNLVQDYFRSETPYSKAYKIKHPKLQYVNEIISELNNSELPESKLFENKPATSVSTDIITKLSLAKYNFTPPGGASNINKNRSHTFSHIKFYRKSTLDTFSSINDYSYNVSPVININHFYGFYRFTCPKDRNSHEWILRSDSPFINHDKPCKKCGIMIKYFHSLDTKFYKKWLSNYKKQSAEYYSVGFINSSITYKPKKYKLKLSKETLKQWKITFAGIVEISSASKVNSKIWTNIGQFIGLHFKEVEIGKINPSYDFNKRHVHDKLRIADRLLGYITMIARHINYIINKSIVFGVLHISKYQNLIDKIDNKSQSKLAQCVNFKLFWEKYDYLKSFGESQIDNFVNYLLNQLGFMLLTLNKCNTPSSKKILNDMFHNIVKSIFNNEKMETKIEEHLLKIKEYADAEQMAMITSRADNSELFRLNEIQESLKLEAENAGLGDNPETDGINIDFDPFSAFIDNEVTTSNTGTEDEPDMD
jgi:hypothetical protein